MPSNKPRLTDANTELFAAPQFDVDRVIETNQRAFDAALEAQRHGFAHMAKIGTSVLDFMHRRMRHDAEMAEALGSCKSPSDAYAVYHQFVDTAIEEYSAEFSTLATLCADQTREAMHDAEHQIDETVRPVLSAAE